MVIAFGDDLIKHKASLLRILALINNLPLPIENFLSFLLRRMKFLGNAIKIRTDVSHVASLILGLRCRPLKG